MVTAVYLALLGPVFLLVVFGVMIRFFKAYWLIAGYNVMSKEKQADVDTERLGKFIGNMCFVLAGILAAGAILLAFGQTLFSGIAFALMAPLFVYIIIRAQKYDRNAYGSDEKMKRGSKAAIILIIIFIIIVSAGVGTLLYYSSKPAGYAVGSDTLKISGLYGEEIKYSDIKTMMLKSELPEILTHTNGSALGTIMKGHFELSGIGAAMLFADTSKPPFVYIETDTKIYYLNEDVPVKTEMLFNDLYAALNALHP